MAKQKIVFMCKECGHTQKKWSGKCESCKEFVEFAEIEDKPVDDNINRTRTWVSGKKTGVKKISELENEEEQKRIDTGINEFNRVLGGGLSVGSVCLITGDPGVGKSTLLIDVMTNISYLENEVALYVSGEESLNQIASRAKRLNLKDDKVNLLQEGNVEEIIKESVDLKSTVIVLDSIQVLYTDTNKSSSGSVGQIKESAKILTSFAKNNDVSLIIVGHVTKDGVMAGPKVFEHIVDTVLHIEGDSNSRYRIMRSYKNRFGDTSETGVFAMSASGMKCVDNPSEMFISRGSENVSGCSIFVSKDGNRCLLFEIQSLVTESFSEISKRVSVGVSFQRVSMLLAVMQKHIGLQTYNKDIYVNIVGGIQIPSSNTSCDLALCFSIYSSELDKSIPKEIVSFGEVSLTGEIRAIQNGEDRIKEADKHGFKHIFIPYANYNKSFDKKYSINIIPVKKINEATTKLNNLML